MRNENFVKSSRYILVCIMLLLTSFTRAQYSHTVLLDEGQDFSYDLPYGIKDKNMHTWYWTSYSPSNVEIIKQSNQSVTVRAIKYTHSTVLVQFECYYNILFEGRWVYGGRITFDLNVNIRKPKTDPDPTPDPNPTPEQNPNPEWSDVFEYGYMGAKLFYKITSEEKKECKLHLVPEYAGIIDVPSEARGYKVTSIGDNAFKGCDRVTHAFLPNTLKDIGKESFQDCSKLKDMDIPSEVSTIGENAFMNCISIKEITTYAENPPIFMGDPDSYQQFYKKAILYVPSQQAKARYLNAPYWKDFKEIKIIGETEPVMVSEINLDKNKLSLNSGETYKLSTTISPSNATNKELIWYSSDNDVASVNDDGLVTAKSGGVAIITCEAKGGYGVKTTCAVNVKQYFSIDAVNFPDANFRAYLLKQDYGKDGVIDNEEIDIIWNILVDDMEITNLKGIELFTNLMMLSCQRNKLTSLELYNNTVLTELICSSNQLTTLDLSKNTSLRYLSCYYTKISSLLLPNTTTLETLFFGSNQLSSLDISKNKGLKRLNCSGNKISSLDLSKNAVLEDLTCSVNQLSSLDISKNISLKNISCYSNQIKGTAMDDLIQGLPKNDSNEDYRFEVIIDDDTESNVCTTAQVSAVKAKGWTPYYLRRSENGWQQMEYTGSESTGIKQIVDEDENNVPIYDLSGKRLNKHQKGINIIGKKKVLIK